MTSQLAFVLLCSTQPQLSITGGKQPFRPGKVNYLGRMWKYFWKCDHWCGEISEKLVKADFWRLYVLETPLTIALAFLRRAPVYKYLIFRRETEQAWTDDDIQFESDSSVSILRSASLAHTGNWKFVTSAVSSKFRCQLKSVFGCR